MLPTYRHAQLQWDAPRPPTPFSQSTAPAARLRPPTGRSSALSHREPLLAEMDSMTSFASSAASGSTVFRRGTTARGHRSPPRLMRQPSLTRRVTAADFISSRPTSAASLPLPLSCAPSSLRVRRTSHLHPHLHLPPSHVRPP